MPIKNIYKEKTYCNPMSIPQCPRGNDYGDNALKYTGEPNLDFRSISDPSVLYYDNKWYLYPSYGMCFVSEDFATWKHVRTEPYDMTYSPSVIPYNGKFLMTAHSHGLYIGETPTGPFKYLGKFIMPDGTETEPVDSALFLDDDGRIYIYWFADGDYKEDGSFTSMTVGVELDRNDPRKFMTMPVVIHKFNPENSWEHNGADNQDTKFGWIEGQWMLKHNGRYYMIYSTPGTQYPSYCMAAYYSDEGPLSGFKCQKRNPVTVHENGLVSGAGHGCIVHGPDNSLWAFYTITYCVTHPYERRIGMDRVYVDENGELYCTVTETPQLAYASGGCPAELKPLTFFHRHHIKASSYSEGRHPMYAFDRSALTWWQPKEDDNEPTLCVDMMAPYFCEASRIMWRDINMNYEKGIVPGPYRYIIEGREKVGEGEWKTLLDMSENDEDFNIDYRSFEPVLCREARVRIVGCPKGITPGIVSFTLFGTRA